MCSHIKVSCIITIVIVIITVIIGIVRFIFSGCVHKEELRLLLVMGWCCVWSIRIPKAMIKPALMIVLKVKGDNRDDDRLYCCATVQKHIWRRRTQSCSGKVIIIKWYCVHNGKEIRGMMWWANEWKRCARVLMFLCGFFWSRMVEYRQGKKRAAGTEEKKVIIFKEEIIIKIKRQAYKCVHR